MQKRSSFDLSFEEMAQIGETAFAEAREQALETGLPIAYVDSRNWRYYTQQRRRNGKALQSGATVLKKP